MAASRSQESQKLVSDALQLHKKGDIAGAEIGYREAIRLNRFDADAHHLLSLLLHEVRRDQDALPLANQAARLLPNAASAHNTRAVVLNALGNFAEAEKAALHAVKLDPGFTDAHANLAATYLRLQNHDQAIACLREVLRLEPQRHERLKDLYELCVAEDRLEAVVKSCVGILKTIPNSVAAHLTLGLVFSSRIAPQKLSSTSLSERERIKEKSLLHFQTAARLAPSPETFDAWGVGLLSASEHHLAIEKFDQAISLNPKFSISYENRGRAQLELGQVERAVSDFKSAIAIDQNAGLSHFELARIAKSDEARSSIGQLQQSIQDTGLPVGKRTLLCYALAHRLEKTGNTNDGFLQFKRASSLKQSSGRRATREESWSEKRRKIQQVFDTEFFQNVVNRNTSELPIFIVSMPRSGTTLTEQIIANHSSVHGCGELFAISDIAHTLSRRIDSSGDYPFCTADLTSANCELIANEYVEHVLSLALRAGKSGGEPVPKRITDKMPTNFWHLGLITVLFPQAKIIHVQRDPIDVCWSCCKQNLSWPFCDLDAIATYFENYALLMQHWHRVLPRQFYCVKYESLISDPIQESQKLISFCGLPWEENCLNHESGEGPVRTPSKWQVRQPIYQSSAGAWQKYRQQLSGLVHRLEPYRTLWQ